MIENNWACPVCGSRHYIRVRLSRGKEEYETQFFTCLGCSALFSEPHLFAQANRVRELFPGNGDRVSDVSNERLAIERRYWSARARRLNGGIEPSDTAVVTLWRRGRLD